MYNIEKYFEGEKMQCIVGIIISIICISISVYFLFLQKPLLKGASYSFIPLSLLLLAICIGIVVRTPKDVERVTAFYKVDREKMQMEELPRMEKVMKSFAVVKVVEVCFFVAGLLLAMSFWRNDFVKGIAIGLMVQSAILYLFDHFAANRGKVYFEFLESL